VIRFFLAALLLLAAAHARPADFSDGFESMLVTGWRSAGAVEAYRGETPIGAQTLGVTKFMLVGGEKTEDITYEGAVFTPDAMPAGALVTGIEVWVSISDDSIYPTASVEVFIARDDSVFSETERRIQMIDSPLTVFGGIVGHVNAGFFGGPFDPWPEDPGSAVLDIRDYHDISQPLFWDDDTLQELRLYAIARRDPTAIAYPIRLNTLAYRLFYVPEPVAPGARAHGVGLMSASMKRQRQAITSASVASASGTMTAAIGAGRDLSSRMDDGIPKGSGTMSVALSRSVGGVITTYLFPQPKASGTLRPTMRRGFSVPRVSGGGTMSVALKTSKSPKPSTNQASGTLRANLAARRPVAATASASATMTPALKRFVPLGGTSGATGTMTASLAAVRPIAPSTASASGTMTAGLGIMRPTVVGSASSGQGSLNVSLLIGRSIAATMLGTGTAQGDEGRTAPDLSNLFWRPSLESIDQDPWGNDIDEPAWDNDIDTE
jgi:hypothetical protein